MHDNLIRPQTNAKLNLQVSRGPYQRSAHLYPAQVGRMNFRSTIAVLIKIRPAADYLISILSGIASSWTRRPLLVNYEYGMYTSSSIPRSKGNWGFLNNRLLLMRYSWQRNVLTGLSQETWQRLVPRVAEAVGLMRIPWTYHHVRQEWASTR